MYVCAQLCKHMNLSRWFWDVRPYTAHNYRVWPTLRMNVNLETLLLLVFKTMLNIYVGFRLIHTYNHRGAKPEWHMRLTCQKTRKRTSGSCGALVAGQFERRELQRGGPNPWSSTLTLSLQLPQTASLVPTCGRVPDMECVAYHECGAQNVTHNVWHTARGVQIMASHLGSNMPCVDQIFGSSEYLHLTGQPQLYTVYAI